MNDDIVTRLRAKHNGHLSICTEAADEIERLRADNEAIKNRLEEISRERDRWMSQTF